MNGPRTNLRLTIAPETPIDRHVCGRKLCRKLCQNKMDGLNPTTAGMPSHASRIGA